MTDGTSLSKWNRAGFVVYCIDRPYILELRNEMKKYKIVLFDMDGTILDTLKDLADSVNWSLRTCGLPERSTKEIRSFLGNGMVRLIKESVPAGTDEATETKVRDIYKAYYGEHSSDTTKAFDGICDVMRELKARGYRLACVSNKPDDDVARLVARHFDGLLDYWSGAVDGMALKPAPDLNDLILSRAGLTRADAVYVGDTEVDMMTAKNSGMDCIVCGWGFRDRDFLTERGAKRILDEPAQILELLE